MKKIIAIALASLMMLALFAGCASSDSDKPVLKVATSPDFAPMEFVDADGNFVGFDISLAQFIADELGMELQVCPMDFDACQTAVATGNVDLAIAGFSWLPEREENYNLSDYYYAGENESEQVLITMASNGDMYATAESLAGKKVGAQSASLQYSLCEEQLPDCEIVVVNDINTALQQLQKGDFDVLAVADGNADAIIANNPQFAKSGFQFEVDEKMTNNLILIQKGNDDLTEKVNAALAKALAAGYYETWYEEALNTAGVEVSYDENGNAITESAEG